MMEFRNGPKIVEVVRRTLTYLLLTMFCGLGVWANIGDQIASVYRASPAGMLSVAVASFMTGMVAGIWFVKTLQVRSLDKSLSDCKSSIASMGAAQREYRRMRDDEVARLRERVAELESGDHAIRVAFDRLRPKERMTLARMMWVSDEVGDDYARAGHGMDVGTLKVLRDIGAISFAGTRVAGEEDVDVYVIDPAWHEWLSGHMDELPKFEMAAV